MDNTIVLLVCSLLLSTIPFCTAAEGPTNDVNDYTVDQALAELERSYDGLLPWLAKLYNPQEGGFHLAHSALSNPTLYYPSLDATGQSVNILKHLDLIERMPDKIRQSIIHYYHSRQDPKDGFFKDPDKKMRTNGRLKSRGLSYSSNALKDLAAEAVHPLPSTTSIAANYPELRSLAAWEKYLNKLNWKDPYRSGDWSSTRVCLADRLDEPLRSQVIDYYFSFVETMHSKKTGLFGHDPEKRDYDYISGLMKICLAYNYYQRPFAHADAALSSIVWVLEHNHRVESNYCYVRNPLSALKVIMPYLSKPINDQQKVSLIRNTTRHHLLFLQKDGGFSRQANAGFTGEASIKLAQGLREGDTNASTQAIHTVRPVCYLLAGKAVPPIKGAAKFYEQLETVTQP